MTAAVSNGLLDQWVTRLDGPVALRLKQKLEPVAYSRVIFPPTYADKKYNIDVLGDETRVATIDSVGSQANRLEPIFKSDSKDPARWLVPQIEIVIRRENCGECEACRRNQAAGAPKKGKREPCQRPRAITQSLLDLAHRAADAVVQWTPGLANLIAPAFRALARGDAGPLCAIAPTSLVFGVWDSRGTGVKRPRLVRSVIRACDVVKLHAPAQYNSVWKLLDEEQRTYLDREANSKKVKLSEVGLQDAPASNLGGVIVKGDIEREVIINLIALRGLHGADESETVAIRRYVFGLSLMAATADFDLFLREGCLLRYADHSDHWEQVPRRGLTTSVKLDRDTVVSYAMEAAEYFRAKWPAVFQDKWPELVYEFDIKAVTLSKAEKGSEEAENKE